MPLLGKMRRESFGMQKFITVSKWSPSPASMQAASIFSVPPRGCRHVVRSNCSTSSHVPASVKEPQIMKWPSTKHSLPRVQPRSLPHAVVLNVEARRQYEDFARNMLQVERFGARGQRTFVDHCRR